MFNSSVESFSFCLFFFFGYVGGLLWMGWTDGQSNSTEEHNDTQDKDMRRLSG